MGHFGSDRNARAELLYFSSFIAHQYSLTYGCSHSLDAIIDVVAINEKRRALEDY